jgi:glycosyltransferase involved in cell wall biosynthesis
MSKNIGFVSTRFAGTDGVSLESSKWAEVLQRMGHACYWFAGELDRKIHASCLVPEAHFKSQPILRINGQIFGKKGRTAALTEFIHELRSGLKIEIQAFIDKFRIDLLVVENAFSIPLHVPLGIALAETISETQIPTIAHHHDFYWERTRFLVNAVGEFIDMAFPPNLPNIEHVVINSEAQKELAHRRGISSTIIPNVLEFEKAPLVVETRKEQFRKRIGLAAEDIMILQPTRVIRRKGIELAIELVKALEDDRCKLVISHECGDEGFEYADWLKDNARKNGVDLRVVSSCIASPWTSGNGHRKKFSLWNVYPHADFITFPSLYEGFGNAFLEAVYFKKPMLINRYATFVKDIEPKGFDLIAIDGFLSKESINSVKTVLYSLDRRRQMVNHNYSNATVHYSYSVLQKRLAFIVENIFGNNGLPLGPDLTDRERFPSPLTEKAPAQLALCAK